MGKISCFNCNRKCKGDVLKVGEKYFHKECFTCKVCHKKMENTGFFCKDDYFYCLEDYKQHCASCCFSCNEKIIGEVVTALNHTFHKDCFKCTICKKCFSPGDRVSMRNSDFLCHQCCGKLIIAKDTVEVRPTVDRLQMTNGQNHMSTASQQFNDVQSSTIPIRRKNNQPNIDRPLSHNLVNQINAPSIGRLRDISIADQNLDNSATPKHFHLPPGNSRAWLYNSPIVGSKSHPLALSANNINRSLSNSSQKIDNDNLNPGHNFRSVNSYPSGDIGDIVPATPTGRDHRFLPTSSAANMSEKNRRKMQNPTVEALSAGTAPRIRKTRATSQKADRNGTSSQSPTLNRLRLSEVIKRSTVDCSTFPRANDPHINENDVPRDPVSASRSPSAVCEPLVPPRYIDHTEASPSRNDEYFRSSQRHLGFSMEFINSTSRSFISENTAPGYRRSLQNSKTDLNSVNISGDNGLKKTRVTSNIVDYNRTVANGKHYPRDIQLQHSVKTIPYEQLRVSNLKMIKNIDKSNLESYLTDEEFIKLFQLTKSGFYQLPEWKRNDLKKRVDLF